MTVLIALAQAAFVANYLRQPLASQKAVSQSFQLPVDMKPQRRCAMRDIVLFA
jgi:hypothetical protein